VPALNCCTKNTSTCPSSARQAFAFNLALPHLFALFAAAFQTLLHRVAHWRHCPSARPAACFPRLPTALQVWEQPGTEKPVLEPMFAAGFHGIELAFTLLAEFISDGRRCGGEAAAAVCLAGVQLAPPADKLLQTFAFCAGMSPSGREWSWLPTTLPHRYGRLPASAALAFTVHALLHCPLAASSAHSLAPC
jgi:hypothetical protein